MNERRDEREEQTFPCKLSVAALVYVDEIKQAKAHDPLARRRAELVARIAPDVLNKITNRGPLVIEAVEAMEPDEIEKAVSVRRTVTIRDDDAVLKQLADLRQQLAEARAEQAWIRGKLKLQESAESHEVYGQMHVLEAHARGYTKYIEAHKCDDKQGEIARQSVQLAAQAAELATPRERLAAAEAMAGKIAERVYECSERLRAYEVPDVKSITIELLTPLYAQLAALEQQLSRNQQFYADQGQAIAERDAVLGECREYVSAAKEFQDTEPAACKLLARIDALLGEKGGEDAR